MMPDEVHDLSRQAALLKVIADETRLRILGLLSDWDYSGKELATILGLTPPTISHHMRKLGDAGIVNAKADAQRMIYSLNTQLLRDVRKQPVSTDAGSGPLDEREKTLRNFFDGERLKSIPARRKQRVVVLQKLVERFEPGRGYPESDVNDLLRRAHEDVATLRRELIDYGFMTRESGIYEVAETLPPRSRQVSQEITGDEHEWLAELLGASLRGLGQDSPS
jgi:DNA-binding HxlR family transcriptional regulator